jgi:hypothetical protein
MLHKADFLAPYLSHLTPTSFFLDFAAMHSAKTTLFLIFGVILLSPHLSTGEVNKAEQNRARRLFS